MILRVNTEDMQVETLLDVPVDEAIALMTAEGEGKRTISLSRLTKKSKPRSEIKATTEVSYDGLTIRALESGTIELERDGAIVTPVYPALKDLALKLNISLLNSSGNLFNTRQLGSQIIKTVAALVSPMAPAQGSSPIPV